MISIGYDFLGDVECSDSPRGSIEAVNTIVIQSCIVDEFYATKNMDETALKNDLPDKSDWNYDTIIHATFNGDLYGGNIEYTAENFNKILVKRREKGTSSWLTLHEKEIVTNQDFSFSYGDYYARGNINYEYAVVPVSPNSTEGSYITGEIRSKFGGIWIVDSSTSLQALYNLSLNTTIHNGTTIVRAGGGKHPHVHRFGESGDVYGTISTTFYPKTTKGCIDLMDAADYRRSVVDPYLYNGEPKIIKHWDGRIWLVIIVDDITVDESEDYRIPIYTFNWQTIGEPDNQNDLYDSNLINVSGR